MPHPKDLVKTINVQEAERLGILTRAKFCSECGAEGFVEGHHDDYTYILCVRWLCRKCHKAWHKANKAKWPSDHE